MINMKWTPIKESLPPEPKEIYDGEDYLITIVNNQVVSARYIKTKVRNEIVCRWEFRSRICPWEVIAWMTFPSAYIEK